MTHTHECSVCRLDFECAYTNCTSKGSDLICYPCYADLDDYKSMDKEL